MSTYIALLRGINVGGNNIIRMADLKNCLQNQGFDEVQTYIQSGNVILESELESMDAILSQIQSALQNTFDYRNPVILIQFSELNRVISDAPPGFGDDNENNKYDVLYLKKPLTAAETISEIPIHEDVDSAWVGSGVIYYRRNSRYLTKSMLNKIPSKPVYQKMTIRNWRTTNKIYEIAKKLDV